VKVQGWHKVLLLRHLRGLLHLNIPGDLTPLTPVAEIPDLTRLSLFQTYALRDLGPLRRSTSLRTLQLSGCTFLTDLTPLRDTAISELHLHHMERADLSTLVGAAIKTLVLRDGRLPHGLAPIPAELPLVHLRIDNLADRRNLRGIGLRPGLTRVECAGIPTPEEIAELSRLPNLRDLVLRDLVLRDLVLRIPASQSVELAAVQSQLPAIRVTRT
jgi:hypothetical protein